MAINGEGSERISLSRETLRAELSQLELRLVDRLTSALSTKADSAIVEQIDKRVDALELSRAAREHLADDVTETDRRVTKLERFRYAVPSVAVISALAALAELAYLVIRSH
jgi:hypothetical protein